MLVVENILEYKALKSSIVTIGTFDGVHIGHQSILERMNDVAKEIGGESVMLTFYPSAIWNHLLHQFIY